MVAHLVTQVLPYHSTKRSQEILKPLVVGVYVLDMVNLLDYIALFFKINRDMLQIPIKDKFPNGRTCIRANGYAFLKKKGKQLIDSMRSNGHK